MKIAYKAIERTNSVRRDYARNWFLFAREMDNEGHRTHSTAR